MYLNNQRAVQLSDWVGADRTQGLLLTHPHGAHELSQSVMAMVIGYYEWYVGRR